MAGAEYGPPAFLMKLPVLFSPPGQHGEKQRAAKDPRSIQARLITPRTLSCIPPPSVV